MGILRVLSLLAMPALLAFATGCGGSGSSNPQLTNLGASAQAAGEASAPTANSSVTALQAAQNTLSQSNTTQFYQAGARAGSLNTSNTGGFSVGSNRKNQLAAILPSLGILAASMLLNPGIAHQLKLAGATILNLPHSNTTPRFNAPTAAAPPISTGNSTAPSPLLYRENAITRCAQLNSSTSSLALNEIFDPTKGR